MSVGKKVCQSGVCLAVGALLVLPATVAAAPPAPVNDAPTNPTVIAPGVPAIVFATLEGAVNDIQDTGLPGVGDGRDDGPDVFFQFTPDTTDTYRIQVVPWQRAPLRSSSSERRFVLYAGTDFDTVPVYIDGLRAPSGSRVVHIDVALTAGIAYDIGVDHDSGTRDNCSFTLIVDTLPAVAPDDCSTVEAIPATLPYAALNDIDGAAADFTYDEPAGGMGRCAVKTATTASGVDHVYVFNTPVAGDFAFELISENFDGVLYISDSCPPFTAAGCLGASHNAGSGGGKHDLVVATLDSDRDYYIVVDEDDGSSTSGNYVLMVDEAFGYEINEIEPNESTAEASPLTTPLNGGQLQGPLDVDWFSITGQVGDRVYAWANNGGTSNTTLDLDMGLYATDGVTLIEFDDEDADGISTGPDYDDLDFIYSTSSPVLAGATLTADGTHYLNVNYQSSQTHVVHRYRLHVGVEPATRTPLAECEPNDTLEQADRTGKHYYAGVIPDVDDVDTFVFDAAAGDRVFIALDGDPERNADGFVSASSDPFAFHAKLIVLDPDGDMIFDDISDSNSVQTGLPVPGTPDYPAQGGFFVARVTGTHYVQVKAQSTSSSVDENATYELAIFLNDAAPAMTDESDPDVTLTPDFANNTIAVEAVDNLVDDTGICDVELFDNNNLVLNNLSFTPGDGVVTFDIDLVNPAESGAAKMLVTDCQGNTACMIVSIDIDAPTCEGVAFSNRTPTALHDPIHVTDNDLTGINGTIEIGEPGLVTDVSVTMTIDTLDPGDLDIYLVSPTGTEVELVTDRMSSLAIDMIDATFDDDAEEIVPFLSSAAPYTGTWLPEDPDGLAQLNGEQAMGVWSLNVRDDSSSADFGATLREWSLDLSATFAGPQTFAGIASDTEGVQSIVLTDAVNVQLNLPAEFTPGDMVVHYTVTLIDTTLDGSGTITVTDLQQNTCQSILALNGLDDAAGPANDGAVTTDLTIKREVQEVVVESDPAGVVSTINVPDSFTVGEVEVALMVDSDNQGRMAAKLTHAGEFASLVNRIGQDDRSAAGNTKNSFDILLDDDAPQEDDIHAEPALGSIAALGLHQPDGRGDFFGDGITSDPRDDMLFNLAGLDSAGDWDLLVADTRMMSSSDNIFRRWALTLKSPCGPERYVGRALDLAPGAGICTIELAAGASNLVVVASFTPGDEVVDYRVELVDPDLPGTGTLEITDCASNTTSVAIDLAAASADVNPPVITGDLDLTTFKFEGTATDDQLDDGGIVDVSLMPWSDNLQIVELNPDPPAGDASVDFVITRIDELANGRGYVRVTDACGWRSYMLLEIDAVGPVCTGSAGNTKRYLSTDLPQPLPDNNPAGVSSSIVVADTDIISDVNLTFNITHPFDDDIDMNLTSPTSIALLSDIGSTGNDFIDTTLDDEAPSPIPDSSSEAPFTDVYQPEGGPALFALDGFGANGTYTLHVADDKTNDTGTFDSWSLTIESATFPERYDGRAEDSEVYGTGICSIELDPASVNLMLSVDPFTAGDAIVRYSVELISDAVDGLGTVIVTDCAGNTCEVPVVLSGPCGWADLDGDGDIDHDDYLEFLIAYGHSDGQPEYNPDADFDSDGVVTLLDYQEWLLCYRTFVDDNFATPPGPPDDEDLDSIEEIGEEQLLTGDGKQPEEPDEAFNPGLGDFGISPGSR